MQATCRNIYDSLALHSSASKPALSLCTYLLRFSILQWSCPTQFFARYVFKSSLSKNFEHLSFSITERVQTVVILLEEAMMPASKIASPVLSATEEI